MDNYKEYLDPPDGYALVKQSINMPLNPNWIEIPEGAELMTAAGKELVFWKSNGQYSWHTENSNEWEKAGFGLSDLESYMDEDVKIVWERNKTTGNDQGLISGAEALRALADGKEVECQNKQTFAWFNCRSLSVAELVDGTCKYRVKPTTLTVNAELPKPSNTTLHNQNYSVTYEFSSREERNAFVEGLGGNNS